jgi:carbonic anhydrase/acetyltransferase-like protein (isoleucine patch superfamily)
LICLFGENKMTIYEFEKKKPSIGKGTFIFKSTDLIGDVVIGKNCYIGPGARIRGDYGSIRIGDNTAIEENVVIHARPNDVTNIGNNVTIGHAAIVHNANIHDWAIIGMGAIVSDWAEIGEWAVVAEGTVVKNKQVIPSKSIAIGTPAKILSEISLEYEKRWTEYKKIYSDLARKRLPSSLREIG